MTEVERAVETLTKSIIQGAKHEVNNASYDVTLFGVIKSKVNNGYVVTLFGSDYTVRSSQDFQLCERVAVTAPQGNYNNLLLHKI